MGKTSYKSTSELIQILSGNMEKLTNGKLNVSELDDLVNTSRDLYELLVILRFKAFDGEITSTETATPKEVAQMVEEKVEEIQEPSFDFSTISDETETTLGFDFTMEDKKPEVESTPEKEEELETVEPEEEIKETTAEPEPLTFQNQEEENSEEEADSLNDLFKDSGDLSLRKKFQNAPIEDIKSHISIAKKFEYINNMFGGDATSYNESIEFLNSGENVADARGKLDDLSKQYQWNLEDKSIIKFIELVERRYQ